MERPLITLIINKDGDHVSNYDAESYVDSMIEYTESDLPFRYHVDNILVFKYLCLRIAQDVIPHDAVAITIDGQDIIVNEYGETFSGEGFPDVTYQVIEDLQITAVRKRKRHRETHMY